ncbi:hypothetical protein GCM10010971_26480 [Silvimonas amylolytica]|uniref:Uncharacterized protein n=2 Tax=Silvimonas amylolytica TaxID=449663 RepID=A0ABQ2PNJ6_9NEIS|nr:hypothetical protein GCM10010971_26480 [Silvimonas amylolytica]
MRFDTRSQMNPEDLPFEYRLELELHWLRMLAAEVRDAGEGQISLNTFSERNRMQMIEMELAHRNLNTLLAQAYKTPVQTQLEDALGRIAHVERDLVETSEHHDGAPLTSFALYFIDYLLPILGLGILIAQQPKEFKLLGERCCEIFSKYTQLDPQEFIAYRAYWSACTEWREANGAGLADHLLRRASKYGLHAEITSP